MYICLYFGLHLWNDGAVVIVIVW